MTDFQDILNKPLGDIDRPKPYPVGSYVALVEGLPKFEKVGENQTQCVDFTLRFLSEREDVDKLALMEAGGINGKTIRHRVFLTEDSVWRAKKFLVEDLGIDDEGGQKRLSQVINEAPGRQVIITIRHRPAKDGSVVYSEISQTAKV
jgi:hypothetical protein